MKETIILAIQKKGEELFEKRKQLAENLAKAQKALLEANEALNLNEGRIAECAEFLQEHVPTAVSPNWWDYYRVDNLYRPDEFPGPG